MKRFVSELTRDWRFRTLVPVVLIHIFAFGLLFATMYHFADRNMRKTHQFGAEILLAEVESSFHMSMLDHRGPALWTRLSEQARVHQLVTINVYDAFGNPIVSTRGGTTARELEQARGVLGRPGHPTVWTTTDDAGGNIQLSGLRLLKNDAECQACHCNDLPHLGAIQMEIDLTKSMVGAKARVRRTFTYVAGAWLILFGLTLWIRYIAIGKPIRQIQKAVADAGSASGSDAHDLDALASHLHGTIWSLIRAQREREESVTQQMARAEQLAALGELAAGLTHEIKNPLAGVIAVLELLRSEAPDGPGRELHDQMLAELRRVTGTVESLLRLARPQPPQRVDTDLSRVVREVASLFSARLRRLGVALETEIPESVPTLSLDQGLMVQLLINLLTNSMQACDRGGVVKIVLAPFPRRDGVALAVSDTGKGISAADLEHVFAPFFTTKEEGTGLGLAICRQIVDQHGGTITVASEAGKGTRVVVLLPGRESAQIDAETLGEDLDGAAVAG